MSKERSKSGQKRARQSEERRISNKSKRSRMNTYFKKVLKVLDEAKKTGDLKPVQEAYIKAQQQMDRCASKGIIHRNKAARLKSNLVARIKEVQVNAAQ